MFKVVKRDGETDDFNLAKIRGAIEKAFKATGKEYTAESYQQDFRSVFDSYSQRSTV